MDDAERPDLTVAQPAMALTGEAPVWDEGRATLWWIDIQGQRLLGHRPGGEGDIVIAIPSMPGLVALAEDGRLALGLEDGIWLLDPETRVFEPYAKVDLGPEMRLNDGKPDGQGRLWFGSMCTSTQRRPNGRLHRLDADGTVHAVLEGITVPNAIAISPDGATLYFADSPTRRIDAFAIDQETGALSDRRTLAAFDEGTTPDGASVDAEGALWVAVMSGGRIERIHHDGARETVLRLPVARVTMPAFGGADLRTVFVTSQRRFLDAEALAFQPHAGHLLAARTDMPGLPTRRMVLGLM